MQEGNIYRLLFEKSGEGILLQQGGRILLTNQSFCAAVGYTIAELQSFSLEDLLKLVHPQDREIVAAVYRDWADGKEVPDHLVYRYIRRDGKTGWWSSTISSIQYENQPALLWAHIEITSQKENEDSLERGGEFLSAVLDTLPFGVCLNDEQGYYRLMNKAYCAIYEYARDEMLGQHYSVIMPPDQIALANAHYARMLQGDTGIPVERKRKRKDGSIVYIEAANALVKDRDGQTMVITTVRDITERKRNEELIQLRLSLLEYATTHALDEIIQKALNTINELTGSQLSFFLFASEPQQQITLHAWSARMPVEMVLDEENRRIYSFENSGPWAECVLQRKPVIHNHYAELPDQVELPDSDVCIIRELIVPILQDGQVVAILGVANKLFDYDPYDTGLVSFIADMVWVIVEKKRAEEKIKQLNERLEHLAMTDELTGLMNRRSFANHCEVEIIRAQRYQTPLSLLLLDLDHFKDVNDNFGHNTGDSALQHISRVLVQSVRATDIVARMGGEEFSILLPDTSADDAYKMAERIRQAVEHEICQIDERPVKITVSIGVGAYSENLASLDEIIKHADTALYEAKRSGRNKVCVLT